MALKRILGLLAVLFCVFGVSQTASAGCWEYWGGTEIKCTGAHGCQSFYFQYTCGPGCVSGECSDSGGGGQCCGHNYDNAVIYPDGGNDCDPDLCGKYRSGGHPTTKAEASSVDKTASQPSTAERFSRLILVPDRCAHRYGVVVQENPRIGGM